MTLGYVPTPFLGQFNGVAEARTLEPRHWRGYSVSRR